MLKVSIANDPAHESALKLLLLWRPNLESGQPVAASALILGKARQPTSSPPSVEPPVPSPDWFALSEYSPLAGTQCPAAIRFWDGSEQTLTSWYEILTLAVEKLYTEGLLTDDASIQSSKKHYILHTEPVHPTGVRFVNYRSINGSLLFVNVNLNAWQVRQNAKRVLQHCGQNPAGVYLQAVK